MADITNPRAVRFCNERVRVWAEAVIESYNTSVALLAEWNTNTDLATVLPNVPTDVVIDGAAQDGRSPMTGEKANVAITIANQLVNRLEQGSPRPIDRIRQIAKDPGRSRF